jgi:hypothetical protein
MSAVFRPSVGVPKAASSARALSLATALAHPARMKLGTVPPLSLLYNPAGSAIWSAALVCLIPTKLSTPISQPACALDRGWGRASMMAQIFSWPLINCLNRKFRRQGILL